MDVMAACGAAVERARVYKVGSMGSNPCRFVSKGHVCRAGQVANTSTLSRVQVGGWLQWVLSVVGIVAVVGVHTLH